MPVKNPLVTIIIPHKNIPGPLQRCLDSIPRRNDIQILIIDDNSDPGQVDFEHFPGLKDPRVEVIFTKEGKGAGYARNTGLSRAKGEWLLFADADDFYNYCLSSFLDEYCNSPADIVYFKANCVDSDTYINSYRNDRNKLNANIDSYINAASKSEMDLRYHSSVPWGKLIKKSLVDNNNIRFDETSKSNDVTFSYLAGHHARSITADKRAVYCVTLRDGSIGYGSMPLIKKIDLLYVTGKAALFFREHNIPSHKSTYIKVLLDLYFSDKTGYAQGKKILTGLGYTDRELSRMMLKTYIEEKMSFIQRVLFFIPRKIILLLGYGKIE
ncbi:glycosyl transferase [Spirochaetia bacterium]|nr:glycosyl transferase [Spirochaetia bacterium]